MLVMRPVMMEDLDPRTWWAEQTGHGLTTLPARSAASSSPHRGFAPRLRTNGRRPSGETYLFVHGRHRHRQRRRRLRHHLQSRWVPPFYAYRIETSVRVRVIYGPQGDAPSFSSRRNTMAPARSAVSFSHSEYRRTGKMARHALSRQVPVRGPQLRSIRAAVRQPRLRHGGRHAATRPSGTPSAGISSTRFRRSRPSERCE